MLFYLRVCVPRGAKAEREPYIRLFYFLEYSRFLVCTADHSLLLDLKLSPHTEESWIVFKNNYKFREDVTLLYQRFCQNISFNVLLLYHMSLTLLTLFISLFLLSRARVVGIATGCGLDHLVGVGVRVPVESRIFSTSSTPALEPTQPPIQ
jgi:hypothetical protein